MHLELKVVRFEISYPRTWLSEKVGKSNTHSVGLCYRSLCPFSFESSKPKYFTPIAPNQSTKRR